MVCFPVTPGQTPMPFYHPSLFPPLFREKAFHWQYGIYLHSVYHFKREYETVSGCRELNPVYMHPMHAYYRYTTARTEAKWMSEAHTFLLERGLMIAKQSYSPKSFTKRGTPAAGRPTRKSVYYRKAQMPTTSFHSRIFLMMNGRFALLPSCPTTNRAMRSC